MLSSRILAACSAAESIDLNAGSVVLLLHGDGTEGSKTFIDSSSRNHSITTHGNAMITNVNSKFGGSAYFDGVNSYLTVANDFNFDANDFTIEMFFYQSSTPNGSALIAERYTGSGDTLGYYIAFYNPDNSQTGSNLHFAINDMVSVRMQTVLPNHQWHHVAGVRHGNSMSLFVNGTLIDTKSFTGTISNSSETFIGKRWDNYGNQFFNGYIDEFRITSGLARYTADFTPPTAPFPNP